MSAEFWSNPYFIATVALAVVLTVYHVLVDWLEGRTRVYVVWGAILIMIAVTIIWLVPKWQLAGITFDSSRDRLEMEDTFRRTIAQIVAGAVIVAGLLIAWQRSQAARVTADATLARVRATESGQIADRFTRAIDQLGASHEPSENPKIEIRLGAIYALEQIMGEDPKNYHRQIVAVLTAYVRENAPWRPTPKTAEKPSSDESEAADGTVAGYVAERTKPSEDVQAVLTVIGRREVLQDLEPDMLDLSSVDLRGADLSQTHLEGAMFIGTHLEEAILMETHLEGAILIGIHLELAHLNGSHLEEADLEGARLEGANLAGAHMEGTFLNRADLEGITDLTRKQLCLAYFDATTVMPNGKSGYTREQVCDEKVQITGLLDDEDEEE